MTIRERGQAFLDFLCENKIITATTARRATSASTGTGQALDTALIDLGLLDETRLADALAQHLNLQRIHPNEFPSDLPLAEAIPRQFLRQANILPVETAEATVVIAVSRPLDDDAPRALAYFLGKQPVIRIAVGSELSRHLAYLLSLDRDGSDTPSTPGQSEEIDDNDAEKLRDIAREAPIIRLLNRLVATALDHNASDIHIEPTDDHVRIRYRIDGALQSAQLLEKNMQPGLISRIKILARLNIAEQRLPQDGRIRLAIRGREIDFRVATSPTLHGENVVLRILDRKNVDLDLASLGFDDERRKRIEAVLSHPNGIILVTGPTGSGKTTTLYAALCLLNRPDTKIFSIEDPVEYHLKGVNQIPIRPQVNLDFATALRSVLRQDPDIIMVGEIRDPETANIAVQASLTGHLVLSTLHTNSAAASIVRLRNIGVGNFLIASALRAVLAQRLVRKLCEHCKRPSQFPPDLHFPQIALLGATLPAVNYSPVGCAHCHGTGYSGRTVISELLEVSGPVAAAILDGKADQDVEILARTEGMRTLLECGLEKIASGITSLEEVLRTVASPSA